jgi:CHAT domain-containing protein
LRDFTPAVSIVTVVFANPDFDSYSRIALDAVNVNDLNLRDIDDIQFQHLEGTQRECDILTGKFRSWHWEAESFTHKEATREALMRIHSPYILHLATSGFFLPEEPAPETDPNSLQLLRNQLNLRNSRFFENPMHRSGLALARANTTIAAWKRGEAPPIDNDGIVTAEDVAALDLKGTWLVTLSACDTGSGEAKAGEGVMGLRRGFIEAGAHNLLVALWPLDDEFTVHFMNDFYEVAHESGNASTALKTSFPERAATALTASCIIVVLPDLAGPRIEVTRSLDFNTCSTAFLCSVLRDRAGRHFSLPWTRRPACL